MSLNLHPPKYNILFPLNSPLKRDKGDKFAINADEISSMSSVDSDNELWDSIETKRLKSLGYARSQTKGDRSETTSVVSGGIKKQRGSRAPLELGSQIGGGDINPSEMTTDNKILVEK